MKLRTTAEANELERGLAEFISALEEAVTTANQPCIDELVVALHQQFGNEGIDEVMLALHEVGIADICVGPVARAIAEWAVKISQGNGACARVALRLADILPKVNGNTANAIIMGMKRKDPAHLSTVVGLGLKAMEHDDAQVRIWGAEMAQSFLERICGILFPKIREAFPDTADKTILAIMRGISSCTVAELNAEYQTSAKS